MKTIKYQPLDDLEMFELMQAAYPEKFPGEDDATWEAAQAFADSIAGWEEIADLLGRVVMLTLPMESGITKTLYHSLGRVTTTGDQTYMVAAVRRVIEGVPNHDN